MVKIDFSQVRSSSIKFESNPDFNEDARINFLDQEDFGRQLIMMRQASEVLSVFTKLPVALEIMFGSAEGHLLSEGVICPFTERSLITVRNIWPSLHFLSWKFGRFYPESRFIFLLTQSVQFEYIE